MSIKYILWDNDGVLVETEYWFYEATKKALSEVSITFSKELYMEYMQLGKSLWDLAKESNIDEKTLSFYKNKRSEYYNNYVLTEDISIKGVLQTLKILKSKYNMAIVTTSQREHFNTIHKSSSILDYMDFYLTIEDYEKAKPHPDPYLAAVKKFNAKKSECIIIEDSARGLKSALSANIKCLILKNEFTQTHDFTGAYNILPSINELPDYLESL